MSQSHRPRNIINENGFSLLEVLVSIVVLTIGLMSTALLMANVYKSTVRSRYISLASQLASEELEDLNRYPASSNYTDPHIQVPTGSNTCGISGDTCIGSLTCSVSGGTCTTQTFTDSSGNNTYVSYFDTVSLSIQNSILGQNGVMTETYKMTCTTSSGTAGSYVIVPFSPNGQTPTPTCATSAPAGMTFDRKWVIEMNQPVTGVRRITVLVTLDDLTVQPPVTFQMSIVRP
jgi:prepilin-type N-terminal cleavage/methylation domain-containing protein